MAFINEAFGNQPNPEIPADQPAAVFEVDPAVAEVHQRAYQEILRQMDTTVVPVVDPVEADRVQAAWMEWRTNSWGRSREDQLGTLERDRVRQQERVIDYTRHLRDSHRIIREYEARLRAFNELVESDDETLTAAELEKILAVPGVMGFQEEGDGDNRALFAVTRVFGRRDDIVYDLGDWRLRLTERRDQRDSLFQQVRSGSISNRRHPLLSDNGDLELSPYVREDIRDLMDRGEYENVLSLAIRSIVRLSPTRGERFLADSAQVTDITQDTPIAIGRIRWTDDW